MLYTILLYLYDSPLIDNCREYDQYKRCIDQPTISVPEPSSIIWWYMLILLGVIIFRISKEEVIDNKRKD